jgi:hypothetical protein
MVCFYVDNVNLLFACTFKSKNFSTHIVTSNTKLLNHAFAIGEI